VASSSFDRRVVPEAVIDIVRAFQRRVPCHLGGGAALAGADLRHRLSGDIDLFCHEASLVRDAVAVLPAVAEETGIPLRVVRDAGTFVRGVAELTNRPFEVDIVYESTGDLEPTRTIEGIEVESLADLRAAKVTCLLSRSEPRDLVDLLFLDRAGFATEDDLALALHKDGGVDPAILAWLLGQFPVEPLPQMLEPLTREELRAFRDELRERMRLAAVPRT
jgi:hypothetical protein